MKFEDLISALGLSIEEYENFKKNHNYKIDISDLLKSNNKIEFEDITTMLSSSFDGQEEDNINDKMED